MLWPYCCSPRVVTNITTCLSFSVYYNVYHLTITKYRTKFRFIVFHFKYSSGGGSQQLCRRRGQPDLCSARESHQTGVPLFKYIGLFCFISLRKVYTEIIVWLAVLSMIFKHWILSSSYRNCWVLKAEMMTLKVLP